MYGKNREKKTLPTGVVTEIINGVVHVKTKHEGDEEFYELREEYTYGQYCIDLLKQAFKG